LSTAGPIRSQDRDRPAGLAVAVKDRRISFVELGDFSHEPAQRMQHVRHGLALHRFRIVHDEIDRIAFVHGDPDFGLALESADPRAMTCARIDDHDRRLCRIETILQALVAIACDAEQRVIDRALEAARVEDKLVVEIEQRRFARPLVRDHVVRALPQRVPEQDGPLPKIALISWELIPNL